MILCRLTFSIRRRLLSSQLGSHVPFSSIWAYELKHNVQQRSILFVQCDLDGVVHCDQYGWYVCSVVLVSSICVVLEEDVVLVAQYRRGCWCLDRADGTASQELVGCCIVV